MEVDIDLLEFLQRYANSLVRWDIIAHFGRNPHVLGGASHIASYIGRRPEVTQRELEDLVLLGLLQKARLGDEAIYRLTDDPQMQEMLARFMERTSPSKTSQV